MASQKWRTIERYRHARDAHMFLDGQRKAVGEKFVVDAAHDIISRSKKDVKTGTGYEIEYPGDPNAPARAVINCRCVLVPRVQKSGSQATAQVQPQAQLQQHTAQVQAKQVTNVAPQATNQPSQPVTIINAKTKDELFNAVETKYNNVTIGNDVKQLDFDLVKEAFVGIKSITDGFPEVGENLKSIEIGKAGIMACVGDKIKFNPVYFSTKGKLSDTIIHDVASRWHPKNTSIASIGVHEAGHAVEWFLVQNNPAYTYAWERITAWNGCTEAKSIVSQACKNVKKTPEGKGKTKQVLREEISRYALQTDSETMAEAFGDYYSNGKKASPLAKEIVRLASEKYKAYGGKGNGI